MNLTEYLSGLVTRSTWLILTLFGCLTALSLTAIIDPVTGQLQLGIDPSPSRLIADDKPGKLFYDRVRSVFGSDETLIITVAADNVFTPEIFNSVSRMTQRISELSAVRDVMSLSNALDIRSVDDGLEISPYSDELESGELDLAGIRARVLDNPVYAGSLVSKDADATALAVHFNDITDSEYVNGGVHDSIMRIVEEERGSASTFTTGSPYFKVAITNSIIEDLLRTPPLITAILVLILALSFRTVIGVVAPLLTVAVGVIMTLGTIAALGYSLSMISVLVPPLLMILGFTYAAHVTSEYHQLRKQPDLDKPIVYLTLKHMLLPVSLTCLTTIAGFLAMMLNPIDAVQEFGIFATIGLVYISVLSVTFTPVLLKVLDRGAAARKTGTKKPAADLFGNFVERTALFDLKYRNLIFISFAVLFLLSMAGMLRIHVSTEPVTNFASDSDVRKGFDIVNDKLGGANIFYIVLESTHQNAFKEPGNLHLLQELQDWLLAQPEIGGTLSVADYLMLINQAFNDNDPAFHVIPDSKRLVTQLLFLSSTDELDRIVDSRYQMTSIVVRSRVFTSEAMNGLIERIQARLADLPEYIEAHVTGNPVLISDTLTDIIAGQARSVGLALLLVYLILAVMFMSPRIGFVALLPNVVPVVVYFGSLGFFGISLNPSTSLIAPMVLGIAIDDTIHYFSRFNSEVHRHANDRKATILAMKAVGRPMTLTSVGLSLGFLVLLTSDLRMQAEVGIMASYSLAVAWLSDFLFTPALCATTRFTTLWDALTLDLGNNPQETIPLLNGLRTSQARIVALMGKVVSVPQGRRLIRDGADGNEMYVVIDGKLRTSVAGRDGPIIINTHERGDVVGEAGLFNAKRTADVDVIEDSRLLCLNQGNLDRLSRRYPYIANKVFRNLNKILAGRLSTTTHRLT